MKGRKSLFNRKHRRRFFSRRKQPEGKERKGRQSCGAQFLYRIGIMIHKMIREILARQQRLNDTSRRL